MVNMIKKGIESLILLAKGLALKFLIKETKVKEPAQTKTNPDILYSLE